MYYNYLGEQDIEISGPVGLLERIGRNFEELPTEEGDKVGSIKIEEGEFVSFHRDGSKPYLSTRQNGSKDYPGIDFLRYGVCVSSIWKKDPLNFEIKNYLPSDESTTLKCFKKVYYSTEPSRNKALVHGSLINLDGKGILITGPCWSGKTSLTLGLLEKLNATFISDGNTLLSYEDGSLNGYYLPRSVFVRFSSISSSPILGSILSDIDKAESIQPFDIEYIEEIIRDKNYDVDAGLNLSRRKFSELLGVRTVPHTRIHRIIYPNFSEEDTPGIKSLDPPDAFERLSQREFPKTTSIGNMKHQRDIECPNESIIDESWFDEIESLSVSFDARKNLSISLLEGLL